MFVITQYEQELAINYSDDLAELVADNEAGPLYFKIIYNFMRKTTPMRNIKFNDQIMVNREEMSKVIAKMLREMVLIAAEASDQMIYTTGELAKYFGVSITAINKWILEGRFIGITKGKKNQHTRIPENTLWLSTSGKTIALKEIVTMWEEENKKRMALPYEGEEKEVQKEIQWFEEKFGGTLEETLMKKEKKTPEEETYQEQWAYLLRRSGRSK